MSVILWSTVQCKPELKLLVVLGVVVIVVLGFGGFIFVCFGGFLI